MTTSSQDTRVLIVENDEDWVEIVKENLPGDFRFDKASDVKTVKLLLQTNTYHLIIADLVLCDEDERESEFEADVTKIRRNMSKLIFALKQTKMHGGMQPPIIVITAYKIHPHIPALLNDHAGWIWSWHEKVGFDDSKFRENVGIALSSDRSQTANIYVVAEEIQIGDRNIETKGGAYIGRDAHVSDGGNLVGRDKHSIPDDNQVKGR